MNDFMTAEQLREAAAREERRAEYADFDHDTWAAAQHRARAIKLRRAAREKESV